MTYLPCVGGVCRIRTPHYASGNGYSKSTTRYLTPAASGYSHQNLQSAYIFYREQLCWVSRELVGDSASPRLHGRITTSQTADYHALPRLDDHNAPPGRGMGGRRLPKWPPQPSATHAGPRRPLRRREWRSSEPDDD